MTVLFDYVPSRSGYTFLGWARTASAMAAEFTANGTKTFTMGSEDVTLYAVWQESAHTPGSADVWDGTIATAFGGGTGSQSKALLSAVLDIDVDNPRERIILQGDIPSPINPPVGCRFCQRCPNATEVCHQVAPKLVEIEEDHMIACHLYPECRP